MKTTMNLATSKGFIFRNGKLMAYEFISALVDYESGQVKYTCKLGGEETSFTTGECPIVYKDEESYEASNGNTGKEIRWIDAVSRVFSGPIRGEYQASGCCPLWVIESNEPAQKDAPLSGYLYTEGGWRLDVTHADKGLYFRDRETALLHCDLIVVDENGVETKRPSAASLMKLTDEQMEVVMEVKKALDRAKEMGVQIILDTGCCETYAFSMNHIKKFEVDYDSCGNNGVTDYFELTQKVPLDIYNANLCDYPLNITWKE